MTGSKLSKSLYILIIGLLITMLKSHQYLVSNTNNHTVIIYMDLYWSHHQVPTLGTYHPQAIAGCRLKEVDPLHPRHELDRSLKDPICYQSSTI